MNGEPDLSSDRGLFDYVDQPAYALLRGAKNEDHDPGIGNVRPVSAAGLSV